MVDEEPPSRFGRYRVQRELGRGGMGIVFEVLEDGTDKRFALKVLAFGKAADPKNLERFRREAETARRISHPGVVSIRDIGVEGEWHWFVMDLVEGRNLEDIIFTLRRNVGAADQVLQSAHRRLSGPIALGGAGVDFRSRRYVETLLRLAAESAEALDHAHDLGLVHRDIKPSNLILSNDGRLVVTDFGLVRDVNAKTFTVTGDMIGTPLYMSPEQIAADSRTVDRRSDIYSFGVTLYEALTLKAAYPAVDLPTLMRQISMDDPPAVSKLNTGCSEDVDVVIMKATAKRPADRYPTMKALADDLRALVAGKPPRARRLGLFGRAWRAAARRREATAAAIAVLVVVLVAAAVLLWMKKSGLSGRDEAALFLEDADAHLESRSYAAAWRALDSAERLGRGRDDIVERRRRLEEAMAVELDQLGQGDVARLNAARNLNALYTDLGADPSRIAFARARLAVRLEQLGVAAAKKGDEQVATAALEFWKEATPAADAAGALRFERALGDALVAAAADAAARMSYRRSAELLAAAKRFGGALPTAAFPSAPTELESPGHKLLEEAAQRLSSTDPKTAARAFAEVSAAAVFTTLPEAEAMRLFRRALEPDVALDATRAALRSARELGLFEIAPEVLAAARQRPEIAIEAASYFGAVRHPPAVDWLAARLATTGEAATKEVVILALALQKDARVVDLLRGVLADEKAGSIRALAAWALGRIGSAAAADDLCRAAGSLPKEGGRRALRALIACGGVADIESVILLSKKRDDADWRGECVRLAALCSDAAVGDHLLTILASDAEERVRGEAARGLGTRHDERAVKALAGTVQDGAAPQRVRALATLALGEIGGDDAFRTLIEALGRGPTIVREAAALALGRFAAAADDTRRRRLLASLLSTYREDGSVDVRAAAAKSLAALEQPQISAFLVATLSEYEPDAASDVVRALLADPREAAGSGLDDLLDSYGVVGVLLPGSAVFTSGEKDVVAASCDALGRLAAHPRWTDRASRQEATAALWRIARRRETPKPLARAALDALGRFRGEVEARELLAFAETADDAQTGAVAAVAAAQQGGAEGAAAFLAANPGTRPDDAWRRALVEAQRGDTAAAARWLRKAEMLGFRDAERILAEPALLAVRELPAVRAAIDRIAAGALGRD